MKILTLTLALGALFCANVAFAASSETTNSGQNNSPKKKDLNKLMGSGATDAAERMKPENEKVKEAAELEKGGHILESQVARSLALDHYGEQRINQDKEVLEKEKLKVEELKAAYKKESENFVAAEKKNKSNKEWIKDEEATKLKKAVVDAGTALRNAEIDCKGHESAIASAAEAA
ncbi:MAG: hypothetical protein NT128_02800 [Proteobacteria bacterium]|nr:hypothetical protein [Pseudomonadota bacterium]